MLELKLTKAPAELVNFNPRVQKEGADKVPAADLEIIIDQGSDVLDFFGAGLRSHLYDEKGPRDLAGGMPLRYPHIDYPIKMDHEMIGAKVEIDYGIGVMPFGETKIGNFRVTPIEGGSVQVRCRIQCKPDQTQAGNLYMLQEKKINVSITPPEAPMLSEGDGKKDTKDKTKEGQDPNTADGNPIEPLIKAMDDDDATKAAAAEAAKLERAEASGAR